jgi:four helix bundle protein
MHNFRELILWRKSRGLVKRIYEISAGFPPSEQYGLTNQMRRAAVSIPSNIAEGSGCGTDKRFSYHLGLAFGSACELETQLLLAIDLNFSSPYKLEREIEQLIEIKRMISSLKNKLKNEK